MTKREEIMRRVRFLNKRLSRFGRTVSLAEFLELQAGLSSLNDLLKHDRRVLIEFLCLPSTRKDFTDLISQTEDGVPQIATLGRWLEQVVSKVKKQGTFKKGVAMGTEITDKKYQEEAASISEYSVLEFAQLTNMHPHTVRKRFHNGELKGRQDTKGIFIAAAELAKFKS